MRSYEAARFYFSVFSFFGWLAVGVGFLLAISMGGTAAKLQPYGFGGGIGAGTFAALPGIFCMISGFFLLVLAQTGRASADTAEYTQQMLKVSRDQLEVSNRMLKGARLQVDGFEALQPQEDLEGDGFADNRGAAQEGKDDSKDYPQIAGASLGFDAPDETAPEPAKLTHAGREITSIETGYRIGTMEFETLDEAKRYADLLSSWGQLKAGDPRGRRRL